MSHCLQSHQQTQPLSFLAIDIYAALVFSILKVISDMFGGLAMKISVTCVSTFFLCL